MQSTRELTELRVFLVRHGLRQEDLADAVSLSRVAISNLITGKSEPRRSTVDAILAFCRSHDPAVTYEQLFGEPSNAAPAEAESEPIEAAS